MRIAFLVLLWQYGGCLELNSISNFITVFPKKFLKQTSCTLLTISKKKINILHQVGHVFKILESGLSHKQQEYTCRPKVVSIAESFIMVSLKDLLEFPLNTKE